MLKPLLIQLSQNEKAKEFLTQWPPVRPLVRRFVAGEHLEEAVETVRALNDRGITATLDHLGEHTSTRAAAAQAADDYLRILESIGASGLESTVSLKPTQLGLSLDDALCREHVGRVAQRAEELNNAVCVDMEGAEFTDRTLDLFESLWAEHDNVSTVIQSYLRRSADDVERLVALGAPVRMVKGAYLEPPELAFQDKGAVDRAFVQLTERLLSPEARDRGVFTAIATHDERILRWACEHIEKHEIPTWAYEFQMLYGICRDLQARLAEAGHPVRVYVSYGTEWFPYFMRRLAERPANALFLLKHLVRS